MGYYNMPMVRYLLIEDEVELVRLRDELREKKTVAVDLESDNFHHYNERICLLQLSDGETAYVVDALKVDLQPLTELFEEPRLEKVFHDVDYDGRMILTHLGVRPKPVFDTMVAAKFLGKDRVGLSDLLFEYRGMSMDKSFQKADWSRRPLEKKMLEYAAMDVLYLVDVKRWMEEELVSMGRISWAREEFEYLVANLTPLSSRNFDVTRVKGWRDLDPQRLALLQLLGEWREEKARRLDIPPFRIISTEKLMKIAISYPKNMEELEGTGILSRRQVSRYGREILEIITSCEKSGMELRLEERDYLPARNPIDERAMRCLKVARKRAAEHLGLEPGFLLPSSQMREIVRRGAKSLDELAAAGILRSWQLEILGKDIVRCLDKRLGK